NAHGANSTRPSQPHCAPPSAQRRAAALSLAVSPRAARRSARREGRRAAYSHRVPISALCAYRVSQHKSRHRLTRDHIIMTSFVQIHWLTSYPAALLNRDDSGLAKRMPFGGSMRARISSQCLKRHWRKADDDWSLSAVAGLGDQDLCERSREHLKQRVA